MIDGFLVAVTVFSLGMALIMAAIAWRAIRLARQQTASQEESRSRSARKPAEPTNAVERPTWPPVRPEVRNLRQAIPRQKAAAPPAHAAAPVWTDVVIERTTVPGPGCCDGAAL